MAQISAFELNTGALMPAVGMGCWQGEPGPGVDNALLEGLEQAFKVGYRHFDTAALYENEKEVGAAVRRSGVPRNEVFVTSECVGPPSCLLAWTSAHCSALRTSATALRAHLQPSWPLTSEYRQCFTAPLPSSNSHTDRILTAVGATCFICFPAPHSHDNVEKAFNKSMEELSLDYVDLYLMHVSTNDQNFKILISIVRFVY